MLAASVEVALDTDRLLLVDDDENAYLVLELIEGFGRGFGFNVDLAADLSEAEDLLKKHKYFMVVVDVVFTQQEITGDVFVIDHQQLLRGARPIVITARDPAMVGREQELRNRNIPLLQKGSAEFWKEFKRLSQEALVAWRAKRQSQGGPSESPSPPDHAGDEWMFNPEVARQLIHKAQETLITWLKSMEEDPNQESFPYGGKVYSANMLIEEIQNGTKVGREYIDMLFDLMVHNVER
jgi:CheY-like chemotaxis protein